MYVLTALEVRSPKWRCQKVGWFPLEALCEDLFRDFLRPSWPLATADRPRLVAAQLRSLRGLHLPRFCSSSPSLFFPSFLFPLFPSLPFSGLIIGCWTCLDIEWRHLKIFTSSKALIPINYILRSMMNIFGEDTIQTTTGYLLHQRIIEKKKIVFLVLTFGYKLNLKICKQ